MGDVIRIATIETGGTWGRLAARLSEALQSAGFTVELLKRGGEVPETALRVENGEADLSVTTTFGARAAHNGKAPYTRKIEISGLAEIKYPLHWFVNMIRAETGITSKNQRVDILTLDAEGFTFFARSDLGDEIAYQIAKAIDHHTENHYLSSSIFYSPRFAVRTGAPLHPGAARYYREQGYLT